MDALDALLDAKGKKRKRDLKLKEAMGAARKEIKLRGMGTRCTEKENYISDGGDAKCKYHRIQLITDAPRHFRPIVNGRIYTCSKEYLFESWIYLKMHGIRWIFWMEDFSHPDWEDVKEKEWWSHTDIEFVKVELEGTGAYPTKKFPYTVCKTIEDSIEKQTKEVLKNKKYTYSEDGMTAKKVESNIRSGIATGNSILLVDATASRVVTTTAICIALANEKLFPEVRCIRNFKKNENKVRVALDWYHEVIGIAFTYKADEVYIESVLG